MKHLSLALGVLALAVAGCADDRSNVVAEPERGGAPLEAAPADAKPGAAESAPAAGVVDGCGMAAHADKPASAQSEPAKRPPLAETKFGAAITVTEETALRDIVADPAKFSGKTVRTSGTVVAVCKAAGCWMEVGDESLRAHIKMAGHAFYVPKNADGRKAVLQGEVKAGEPQNECGKADRCGGAENGALAKLEIVATGVEFLD